MSGQDNPNSLANLRPRKRQSSEKLMWSRKTGRAVTHGLYSSYTTHGCRCNECYEAWRSSSAYKKRYSRAVPYGPLGDTEAQQP